MKTVFLLTLLATFTDSFAATIVIPAKSNIFGAGHATPSAPAGGGAGELPPLLAVNPGQAVSFSLITGTVTYSDGSLGPSNPAAAPFGAEGTTDFDTTLSSLNGISSISGTGFLWLVGVFLDNAEPADPAPSGLPSFTPTAKQFTSLSPGLRQVFFIGDGQQAGSPQVFNAPAGATRLFLGFADGDGGLGQAGFYSDNAGSLTVTHNVPEPASAVLLLFGGAWALAGRRATRCQRHEAKRA
jgi:hypothetical protein